MGESSSKKVQSRKSICEIKTGIGSESNVLSEIVKFRIREGPHVAIGGAKGGKLSSFINQLRQRAFCSTYLVVFLA